MSKSRNLKPIVQNDRVGSYAIFSMNSIPAGYMACNGTAISRTTYSELYSLIGTDYGVGDGSTTFNIPDIRGRVLIHESPGGLGSDRSTVRLRANGGGAETHTLADSEIPANTVRSVVGGGSNNLAAGSNTWSTFGGGQAHNNMQPFMVGVVCICYSSSYSRTFNNTVWGNITGLITNQNDLINYINARMGTPYLIDTNLTLDTNAYADGDSFCDVLTLTNALASAGTYSKLESITLIDKDNVGPAMDLFFFDRSVTLPAKNAAWTVNDSDMEYCLGVIQITTADWIFQASGSLNRVCTLSGLDLTIAANSGTNIFFAARIRSVGTFTINGIRMKFGIRRFG